MALIDTTAFDEATQEQRNQLDELASKLGYKKLTAPLTRCEAQTAINIWLAKLSKG